MPCNRNKVTVSFIFGKSEFYSVGTTRHTALILIVTPSYEALRVGIIAPVPLL